MTEIKTMPERTAIYYGKLWQLSQAAYAVVKQEDSRFVLDAFLAWSDLDPELQKLNLNLAFNDKSVEGYRLYGSTGSLSLRHTIQGIPEDKIDRVIAYWKACFGNL